VLAERRFLPASSLENFTWRPGLQSRPPLAPADMCTQ